MLFAHGEQIEKMLELYGIDLPCEIAFTGDSEEVMFKFENLKITPLEEPIN